MLFPKGPNHKKFNPFHLHEHQPQKNWDKKKSFFLKKSSRFKKFEIQVLKSDNNFKPLNSIYLIPYHEKVWNSPSNNDFLHYWSNTFFDWSPFNLFLNSSQKEDFYKTYIGWFWLLCRTDKTLRQNTRTCQCSNVTSRI